MSEAPIEIRRATRDDVDAIVAMLADDPLGRARERYEQPLPRSYLDAFDAIDRDPNQALTVACDEAGRVVGVLQLTFTPYLTYQGGWRATVEGVRTASGARGRGIGGRLVRHAIERARERACHVIQLTTDKRRDDARRFYEALGFVATHEGMKLHLPRE